MAAPGLLAGLRAEIAAVQRVRSHTGEFAALLSKGPESIPQLQQQLRDAEAAMMLIKHNSLKHLIQEVADHNDCHIVVVSWGLSVLVVFDCGMLIVSTCCSSA